MKQRRVAIVADIMTAIGGAEVVVMELLNMFSEADLYTLFISPGALKKIEDKYPKVRVRTSFFQRFIKSDQINKYISIIKIISWVYWEWLDLREYNLIISSSHSYMAKNVKKGKGARHVAYIHTPPRFLYDEFNEIFWIKKKPWKWLFWPIKKGLIYIDKKGSKRPDIMVANSKNVAKRIKKYYGREAEIIYPPVDVGRTTTDIIKNEYYVCLSRLVKQKGIDLAVKMCTKNKIPLVVIGRGGELESLKKLAGSNVEFIEECDDSKKIDILAYAKALIYTSKEEDFGIVPIEALSVGTPVIAYNSGGVSESIIHKKNGVLFNKFTENDLIKAIRLFEKCKITRHDCVRSAKKYSIQSFRKQFEILISI